VALQEQSRRACDYEDAKIAKDFWFSFVPFAFVVISDCSFFVP
jgi:hypothetical protein